MDRRVEFDRTHLLHAHLLRHDNNAAIALHSRSQGQSDTSKQEETQTSLTTCLTPTQKHVHQPVQRITSVSRGGLDDGVSRFEEPGSLSVLHHPQTDPVLHAAAGVEVFTLGHYKHMKGKCVLLQEDDLSSVSHDKEVTP